jgi:hypothetical protein
MLDFLMKMETLHWVMYGFYWVSGGFTVLYNSWGLDDWVNSHGCGSDD